MFTVSTVNAMLRLFSIAGIIWRLLFLPTPSYSPASSLNLLSDCYKSLVQTMELSVEHRVFFLRLRAAAHPQQTAAGCLYTVINTAAHAGQYRSSKSRTFLLLHRLNRAAVKIGQHLPPDRTFPSAATGHHLCDFHTRIPKNSLQSKSEYATPSMTALKRWLFVWMADSPKNTPRQSGSK